MGFDIGEWEGFAESWEWKMGFLVSELEGLIALLLEEGGRYAPVMWDRVW